MTDARFSNSDNGRRPERILVLVTITDVGVRHVSSELLGGQNTARAATSGN